MALDVTSLAAEISGGRRSPTALVEECLARIDQHNALCAFIRTSPDSALADAREREQEIRRGRMRGPLHGVPVAVKDIIDQEGLPNTAGAAIRRDYLAARTATVVTRLLEAGAVIIGRTNLHEFAFGTTSVNPHFGAVRNPWDSERVAGGSSGGSGAAVAARMALAALGTDTGGSIRIPAALCGIVGLKPTFGRVSRDGVVPLSWSFDTVGPMTRSVRDAALLLKILSGRDPRDPLTQRHHQLTVEPGPAGRFRVGRLKGPLFDEDVESEIVSAVDRALDLLSRAGGTVVPIEIPSAAAGQAAQTTILFAEATAYHRRAHPGRLGEYGKDVRELLAEGATIAATDYIDAQRIQSVVIEDIGKALSEVDVLASPTVPVPAPLVEEVDPKRGEGWRRARVPLTRFTRLFNLTGLPAISLPVGRTRAGLPVAIQLAAASRQEDRLLGIAAALERLVGWELP